MHRIARERLLILGDGLGGPVGDRQQQSEVVVGLRIVDPGDRAPQIRLGLLITAHRAQTAADVGETEKVPRHHLVIPLKKRQRFLVTSDSAQHATELDDSLGVIGIELERAPREVLGPLGVDGQVGFRRDAQQQGAIA